MPCAVRPDSTGEGELRHMRATCQTWPIASEWCGQQNDKPCKGSKDVAQALNISQCLINISFTPLSLKQRVMFLVQAAHTYPASFAAANCSRWGFHFHWNSPEHKRNIKGAKWQIRRKAFGNCNEWTFRLFACSLPAASWPFTWGRWWTNGLVSCT